MRFLKGSCLPGARRRERRRANQAASIRGCPVGQPHGGGGICRGGSGLVTQSEQIWGVFNSKGTGCGQPSAESSLLGKHVLFSWLVGRDMEYVQLHECVTDRQTFMSCCPGFARFSWVWVYVLWTEWLRASVICNYFNVNIVGSFYLPVYLLPALSVHMCCLASMCGTQYW